MIRSLIAKKKIIKLEPQLAASMLYYDDTEFESFFKFWTNIDDNPELAPSGAFNSYIKYIDKILKSCKKRNIIVTKDILITSINQYNDNEASTIEKENFTIWFKLVLSEDTPSIFELSEEIFDHYLWLYYQDQIMVADNTNVSYKDKLAIKPPKINLREEEQTFYKISDINKGSIISKNYTTGIESLDEYIHAKKSNFIVIAARPSVGKSIFMLQQALANAALGVPVLFISLEMTGIQIKQRIMNWYKNRYVNPDEFEEIEKEEKFKFINNNLQIMDNKTHNGDVILNHMEEAIDKFGIEIIFLDYLGLVRFNKCDEWASLRKLTLSLKQFGIEHGTLMVSCTQVSRDSTTYGLELTDLYGSASIEADTDIVIGLESIDRDSNDESDEGIIFMKILKNRDGSRGRKMKMAIKYITMNFVDI